MEEALSGTLIQVYGYRWVVLLVFCLYSAINFIQFIQYTIIANIITKYYSVDSFLVDLSGLIFLIIFIPLCLPVNYLIERYNLKIAAIISSGLTVLGNLLKLLSVHPDRFYVAILGQTLCGIAQVFILCLPSKLASVWFGPGEVSTACAIAILGIQSGIALGGVLPPLLVQNSNNADDVASDLFRMLVYNAVITCIAFGLVLIFFKAKPILPPSQSQVNIVDTEKMTTKDALKLMVKNRNYVLLLTVFGISTGLWTTIGLLVNPIYLNYFPGSESEVGIITLITVISGGCIGSVVFGYILDKTHQFKTTSFLVILLAAVAYLFVMYSLNEKIKLATYFSLPILGFFLSSTLVISYEFVTEILYPLPESLSCGILNAIVNVYCIIFTLVFEACFSAIGFFWTEVIIFVLLLIAAGLVYFISPTLHRRNANLGS